MLIINEQAIGQLTDARELTDQMELAMKVYQNGDFQMPDRMHMNIEQNTLLLMPASSGSFFSTKLVSLFPDNPKRNEPVLYGAVLLNDGNSGKPMALINGAKLTAVRTAAVGAVGVRYTSPADSSRLGLIGAGVQGLHQIQFACENRPIKQVYVLDSYPDRLPAFIACLAPLLPQVRFHIAKNAEDLCAHSDIIITATNSSEAVLPNDPEALAGKHIVAIGSYKSDMIEMPDALFPLLKKVYIDVSMALEETGDLIHPLKKGLIKESNIELLSKLFDSNIQDIANETTLYKSVGMALFDLFTAKYLFDKATKMGLGQQVTF